MRRIFKVIDRTMIETNEYMKIWRIYAFYTQADRDNKPV
jgi:hypothetical protein